MLRFAKILLILLGPCIYGYSAYDNDTIPLHLKLTLNVYLDCEQCDNAYLYDNFKLINYVRDPGYADVHVLITTIKAGSGGEEYSIMLKGKRRFQSMNDTIIFYMPPDMALEEERAVLLNKLQLSLVHYIMKTPLGDRIQLVVQEDRQLVVAEKPKDPWRDWVFDIALQGSMSGDKTSMSYSLLSSLYISKITSKIKFESFNEISYQENKINLYDDTTLIYSSRAILRNFSNDNLFVSSLGERGGVGGRASFCSNTYNNLNFQMRIGPAIEGNLFKYSEATIRQLRLICSIYYEHNKYSDKTIYDKLNEGLFQNELNLIFSHIDDWGQIQASLNARTYLHDITQYSANTGAFANIKLTKGLWLNMNLGLGLQRDQIALRQESISTDQYFTQQRAIKTSFSYYFRIGLSIRIGSKYCKAVNPRFSH